MNANEILTPQQRHVLSALAHTYEAAGRFQDGDDIGTLFTVAKRLTAEKNTARVRS